jgi:hypothetical protein
MTQTVRKELLAQLQHLRVEAKEISRLYVANLQRDIVQLIEFLNESEDQTTGNKNSRSANLLLSKMKETLDSISLKPEKGRRKDLRKIEEAIRSMRKIAFSDKTQT